MWDLPGSGLEPMSPAVAGVFLTTAPPGKSPNLLSVSMDLPVLDISYKWNHTIGGLLRLAYFLSVMFSRFIDAIACQHFIPFYCQVIFHCMDMSHFIYSLINQIFELFPLWGHYE